MPVDFFMFGRGAGDTVARRKDGSFGPITLAVPVIYFGRQETKLCVCSHSTAQCHSVTVVGDSNTAQCHSVTVVGDGGLD